MAWWLLLQLLVRQVVLVFVLWTSAPLLLLAEGPVEAVAVEELEPPVVCEDDIPFCSDMALV